MMWFARLAALSLAILLILGGVLWIDLSNRYLATSEVRVALWGNVAYVEVRIPQITSDDETVTIGVLFRVTNPTSIGVEVLTLSYRFYMDNLTDPRPFFEKDDDLFIAVGGYFASEGGAIVGPRSEGLVWANLTILGAVQRETMQRLNLTFYGRYYPIIDAGMAYRVVGTSVRDRVLGIWYQPVTGVAPYGS